MQEQKEKEQKGRPKLGGLSDGIYTNKALNITLKSCFNYWPL
jgi:hypothetical protein